MPEFNLGQVLIYAMGILILLLQSLPFLFVRELIVT